MPTAFSQPNRTLVTEVDMDPSRCNRQDYTRGLTSPSIPSDAAHEWQDLCVKLRALYETLANHSAMRTNLPQTFSTLANSKNKVYFMWDFVGRTLHFLYLVPASLHGMNVKEKDRWEDVQGRSKYGAMLITNGLPGMLDQLTEMTYPGQRGQHPDFGDEVLAEAQKFLEDEWEDEE